jgi:beta-lactamase class A
MRVLVLLLCVSLLAAQKPSTVEELFEEKLAERIRSIDAGMTGVLGVFLIDLETGRTLSHHGGSVFPQASSIKIPIMIEVFRQASEGRLKLSDRITLQPSESVGGSGHLQLMLRSGSVELSVEDLITAMIATSDNTATNRLIALVGMDRVNATLDKLGFLQTRLRRKMLDGEAAARNDENVSTPEEMARLMELIYRGKAVNADASRRMLEILKLPEADFRAAVPAEVAVAAKPGELTGVRCETGVVLLRGRPFILSVASAFLGDSPNPVPAVIKAVYAYFATLAKSNRYGNGGVR